MDTKITTMRTLMHLVNLDNTEHPTKALALLFVSALNDWPTNEHQDIKEAITQFKDFFGHPFVLEKHNLLVPKWTPQALKDSTWRLETGAALHKMIVLAQKHLNTTNFDLIVNNLLAFYEKEFRLNDLIATFKYHKTPSHTNSMPLLSGFTAEISFPFSKSTSKAQVTLLNKENILPGCVAPAKIKLWRPNAFNGSLNKGMKFELTENGNAIGNGKILQVINSKLEL